MSGDTLAWMTVGAMGLGVLAMIIATWPRSSTNGGHSLGSLTSGTSWSGRTLSMNGAGGFTAADDPEDMLGSALEGLEEWEKEQGR